MALMVNYLPTQLAIVGWEQAIRIRAGVSDKTDPEST